MKKLSLMEILKRFSSVHGCRYDYSMITEDNYVDVNTKVPIICKEHGVFYTTPIKHYERKNGCPICKGVKCSKDRKSVPRNCVRTKKFGVGVNDYEGCVWSKESCLPSYSVWVQMLTRCYSKCYHKKCPTYKNCSVCDEWLYFSKFKEWFDRNFVEGYCLDKDIIIKGNKVYSPETCCFVPNEINALLIKHDRKRGQFPIGVSLHNKKYCAKFHMFREGSKCLGTFDTPELAFFAYKKAKEAYIKQVAQEYYSKGLITERVYNALVKYEVEITD